MQVTVRIRMAHAQVFALLAMFASCATASTVTAPSPVASPDPGKAPDSVTAPDSAPASKPAAPKAASHLPQLLQEVEEKYAQAATLQADFTQVNDIAALKTKKTSSGVIMVKRPDKLRWETLKPDMNLLVSDGKHFWFYTPPFDEGEHGQVIERKTTEMNSKFANALLSGRFSMTKDMKILQESACGFLITPKSGTAGTVLRAQIKIDPINRYIEKIVLENKGGNRSEISLTKIQLGKKIGDEAFVFDAPPNTDKVTQ